MTTATYHRGIRYDDQTREFTMYLDGGAIGVARSFHEAETTLDQLVSELTGAEYAIGRRPAPLSCPSCGDPMREYGLCAACREANPIRLCLTCKQPSLDPVCLTCIESSHRCAAGHALDDYGVCEICQVEICAPCGFCRGPHHTQHCKDLLALLCGNDVLMPHILAKLLQRHPSLALSFLSELPNLLLVRQADMQAAWLSSYLEEASADRLLAAWLARMGGECVRGVPRYELLAV